MSAREAMAIGTAGYTAMLAVMALERHGITPARGPVVVTGAAGGVGSVAVALLAKLGYQVIASTGRPEEADYLKGLGAAEIIDAQGTDRTAASRSAKERWAGGDRRGRLDDARQRAVDDPLWRRGRGLRPGRRHGLADHGRAVHPARRCRFSASTPVMCPRADREEAWKRLETDLDRGKLQDDDQRNRACRGHRGWPADRRRPRARPNCGQNWVNTFRIWRRRSGQDQFDSYG